MAQKGHPLPRIDFIAEAQQCEICESALGIQKSKTRTVFSIEAGTFEAREVLRECILDKTHPVKHSESLSRLVKPRQRWSYDLMVHVGLARYLEGKQRTEIRNKLYQKFGFNLSDGTITNLCDRFLIYLETLHFIRAPYLRTFIQDDGYPLHLDATCDKGKGGLFVCMDGWRGWVLMVGKIPSENEDYLQPIIEQCVDLFGDPISLMRDLGPAVQKAVKPLTERGILDLVCHYHFLRAVGCNLFDNHYASLRNMLRDTSVRSQMRALLRKLRNCKESSGYDCCFSSDHIRENLLVLVYWLLEGDGKKKIDYPFALAHLEFFHRCQNLTERANSWLPLPRSQAEQKTINHLEHLVASFTQDHRFADTAAKLQKRWQAFCDLRDVLRLTDEQLPDRANPRHHAQLPTVTLQRLHEIQMATNRYREQLTERVGDDLKSKPSSPDAIILKYLMQYGNKLFGHPLLCDKEGSIIAVAERTNDILEHFFGQQKHGLRRRLGKANLGRDLEDQPAQAFLVSNLRHSEYVRILSGSLDNLPAMFANLDKQKLVDKNLVLRDKMKSRLKRRVRVLLDMYERPVEVDRQNLETAQLTC
jgi:hypothetical protein